MRGWIGRGRRGQREGRADPQIDPDPPAIAPQTEQHIRDDHDENRPLRHLLVQPIGEPQQRDREHAAADPEQAPEQARDDAQRPRRQNPLCRRNHRASPSWPNPVTISREHA